jgi:LDH2 family malate/lactate/ureidoglycolate dehydrogenase
LAIFFMLLMLFLLMALLLCALPFRNEAGPLVVERESNLAAVVNGNQRAGMVALNKAVELAAAKAWAHGVGVVSTRNTSTSTGMLAYYAETLGKVG